MFPKSEHSPAGSFEPNARIEVAASVCVDLVTPEGRVGFRPSAVLGTAMPKTIVNEYGHALLWKGNICPPTDACDRGVVSLKDHAETIKGLGKRLLRGSIAPSGPRHATMGIRRRWLRNASRHESSVALRIAR